MKVIKYFLFVYSLAGVACYLQAEEPAMGLLLTCSSGNETVAELSTEKAPEGTRISFWIYSYNKFLTNEYRASDASARGKLAGGGGASFPAQLLSEQGRRDTITVESSQAGNSAQIKVESTQHGTRKFNCTYVD